jgi:hypothetical protein
MGRGRKEQVYLPIETLGDLARANSDAPVLPLAPPADCSACGGPLVMSWEFHTRGLWWAYASCPACKLFFTRRSPARTAEEWGWQVEPSPPEFVTDPNWVSDLKQAVAGEGQNADPGAAADRPRD